MNRTAFEYEVRARLDFTREEAGFLRDRAREHYDGTCRAAAEPGQHSPAGLINGMMVVSSDTGSGWQVFTFREIDLLCKVLEPAREHPVHHTEAFRLTFALKRALGDIRDEYERLKNLLP
jgi:hypothetical protein